MWRWLAALALACAALGARAEGTSEREEARQRVIELLKLGKLTAARDELKTQLDAASGPAAQADVLSELAELYIMMDKHVEAVGALEEAIELIETAHGEADPRRWMALGKLADAHSFLGNHAEAVKLYKDLVQNMRASPFGDNHPGLRVIMDKLASSASSKGDVSAAISTYRQILKLADGDNSPSAANARASSNLHLARLLSVPKKKSSADSKGEEARLLEALNCAREAMELYKEIPDSDPMNLAYSANGIAGILERLGRHEEAVHAMEHSYQLVLEIKKSESDPDVVRAKKNVDGLRSQIRRKMAQSSAKSEL